MSGFKVDQGTKDTYLEIAKGMKLDAWDKQEYFLMAIITSDKMEQYLSTTVKDYSDLDENNKDKLRLAFLQGFLENVGTVATTAVPDPEDPAKTKKLVNIESDALNGYLKTAQSNPNSVKLAVSALLTAQNAINFFSRKMKVPPFVQACVNAIIDNDPQKLLDAIRQGSKEADAYYKKYPNKKPAQTANPASGVTTDQSTIQELLQQPYGAETWQQMNLQASQTDFRTWSTEKIIQTFDLGITKDDDGEYFMNARDDNIEDNPNDKNDFLSAMQELNRRVAADPTILAKFVESESQRHTGQKSNPQAAASNTTAKSNKLPFFSFLKYCTAPQNVVDPAQQQQMQPDNANKSTGNNRSKLS